MPQGSSQGAIDLSTAGDPSSPGSGFIEVPRGPTGPRGPQGPQGPAGPAGAGMDPMLPPGFVSAMLAAGWDPYTGYPLSGSGKTGRNGVGFAFIGQTGVGGSLASNCGSLGMRREGRLCQLWTGGGGYLRFGVGNTIVAGNTFATLPAGFRPPALSGTARFAAVMVDSGVFTGPEPAEIIVDASGNMSYAGGLDYTGTVSGDALLIGLDGMTYICTDDP